jgi:hypothetical protein
LIHVISVSNTVLFYHDSAMANDPRKLGHQIAASLVAHVWKKPREMWHDVFHHWTEHIREFMDLWEVVKVLHTSATSYAVPDEDAFLLVTTASGAGPYTVTLPSAPFEGQYVVVKDAGGFANIGNEINVDRNGQTINGGALNVVIDAAYGNQTLLYSGTGWLTLDGAGSGFGFPSAGGAIPLLEWFDVTGPGDTTHVVSQTPVGTVRLFLNGQALRDGGGYDYTVAGDTITVLHELVTDDWLLAVYYDTAGAGGGGDGDDIWVNGTPAVDANFNNAGPAAPAGGVNVAWQKDGATPNNISAHLPADSVSDTVLRNSAGFSVIGRSAGTSGDPGDIVAGTDGHVLRRSGATVGFGEIAAGALADNSVTDAKLSDMAANSVKGNPTAGVADPQDIAVGANTVLGRQGGNLVAAQVALAQMAALSVDTAQLLDGAATNAKLADMVQATFKGRNAGSGTGVPVDLTPTQATLMLDFFSSIAQGIVPASGGGVDNFLRADGTWTAPPGAGTGGGRDYLFTLDGTVPAQGEAYLFIGDVATVVAPFVLATDSDFSGGGISVDVADATNAYVVEFLVNGTVRETVSLPSTQTTAYDDTFTYSALAGDAVSARIRRTAGSGVSDFREVTVSLDLGVFGGGGGGGGGLTTSITIDAGEALATGSVVALAADGDVYLADATTSADRWRAFGVSDTVYAPAAAADVHVVVGTLQNTLFGSAPPAANNGDVVYLSETAGEATLIAPTSSGTVVMELGVLQGANGATTTPQILWHPRYVVEIP